MSRRIALSTAAVLFVAAAVLLLVSAGPDLQRQFFGLWRTRTMFGAAGLVWAATLAIAHAMSRRARNNVLLISAQLAAVLILFELAGFAGLVDYAKIFKGEAALGAKRIPNADIHGETTQDLAARWGLETNPIPFHFTTDHRGFRNDEDRQEADIYLLGDSILVGGLLPFSKTITARLEELLDKPVMNISLIDLGIEEERDLFLGLNLPLRGKTVVQFVFSSNDLLDSASYEAERAGRTTKALTFTDRTLTGNLVVKLQTWSAPVDPIAAYRSGVIGEQPYYFLWTAESFRGRERQLSSLFKALGEVRDAVEERGGSYRVVLVPAKLRVLGPLCDFPDDSHLANYHEHLNPYFRGAIRAWSAREQVPMLDLLEPLSEAARNGTIPWFPADTHWNEHGHDIAARQLEAWLESS